MEANANSFFSEIIPLLIRYNISSEMLNNSLEKSYRLAEILEEKGVSIDSLCKTAGLEKNIAYRILHDPRYLKNEVLEKIADALKVKPDEIVDTKLLEKLEKNAEGALTDIHDILSKKAIPAIVLKTLLSQEKRGGQAELAKYLNISRSQVNDWVNFRRPVPLQYLPKIAEFFNVSEDDFFNLNLVRKHNGEIADEYSFVDEVVKKKFVELIEDAEEDKAKEFINGILGGYIKFFRIKSGNAKLRFRDIKAAAEYFNTSTDYFFFGKGKKE